MTCRRSAGAPTRVVARQCRDRARARSHAPAPTRGRAGRGMMFPTRQCAWNPRGGRRAGRFARFQSRSPWPGAPGGGRPGGSRRKRKKKASSCRRAASERHLQKRGRPAISIAKYCPRRVRAGVLRRGKWRAAARISQEDRRSLPALLPSNQRPAAPGAPFHPWRTAGRWPRYVYV